MFSAGFKKDCFLSNSKHIKMFRNLEKTAFYELLMGNDLNTIVCHGTDLCRTRVTAHLFLYRATVFSL